MEARRWVAGVLMMAGLLGCGLQPPQAERGPNLELVPSPSGGRVSVGVRLRIDARGQLPRLFVGELSARQRTRALSGELPKSLQERRVALSSQPLEPGEGLLWVPERLLEPDTVYTLVAPGRAEFLRTRDDELIARLAWPAAGEAGMAALYCFDELRLPREPVELGSGIAARWSLTDAEGRCQALELDDAPPASGVLSPQQRGSWTLPPARFRATSDRLPVADCAEPELESIELGCLRVLDDRVQLHGPEQPTLWLMKGAIQEVVALEAGAVAAVKGLSPNHTHWLDWLVYPQRGGRAQLQLELTSASPQPHVVVNEVLANPNGAEPAQEWVELFNDGTRPVSLEGWVLLDGAGETPLPRVNLLPNQYGLIVNETFASDSPLDVAPEPNVLMLAVERLGKSGLSNAGEALRLLDKDGMVRSSFPSTPKPVAGVSIARRSPWALDDQASSFGVHASPGASPGRENQLVGASTEKPQPAP